MSLSQIYGAFLLRSSFPARSDKIPAPPHTLSRFQYITKIRGVSQNIETSIHFCPGFVVGKIPEAFADGTIAFVLGCLCSQSSGDYSIEAMQMFPFGKGDSIENHPLPRVTIVGHVIQCPITLKHRGVGFPVNALTYIRDKFKHTTFM